MKRCPVCRKDYFDDSLMYCLDDGAALLQGSATEEQATAILSGESVSDGNLTRQMAAQATSSGANSVTLRMPAFLSRERIPWLIATACLLGLMLTLVFAMKAPTRAPGAGSSPIASFYISPPEKSSGFNQLAISPDGRQLAFLATSEGRMVIWLRPIDSFDARPLAGTDGAAGFPFWSRDSRSIYFQTPGKLRRIDLADGTVQTITEIINDIRGFDGTAAPDGTVLFFNGGTGILRLAANQTAPTVLPGYEPTVDRVDRWPFFLPDGKHFLFLATSNDQTRSMVFVGSTSDTERKQLVAADSNAMFTRTASGAGYIIFVREGALLAQNFDTDTNSTIGEPFRVLDRIRFNINSRAFVSVSENATLVFDPFGEGESRQLTWFDRSGKQDETVGNEGLNQRFRLSPDQRLVAVTRSTDGRVTNDLLVLDIARGSSSRLNSGDTSVTEEIWSPDSSRIAFSARRGVNYQIVQKLASGAGQEEVLIDSKDQIYPASWSPDGKFILFVRVDVTTKRDIWILPLDGDRKPFLYFQTPVEDRSGYFSPDGKLIAYQSEESGRDEVYVQTFPASANKWTISTDGGLAPRWSPNGKELFYIQRDGKLMSVDVKTGAGTFEPGIPKPLFDLALARTVPGSDYAVSSDGQRFLFLSRLNESGMSPLAVVMNWMADARK